MTASTANTSDLIGPNGGPIIWALYRLYNKRAVATIQSAPFHRIDGLYYYAKKLGAGDAVFTSDGEIEFVCIPDGLLFDYDVKTK